MAKVMKTWSQCSCEEKTWVIFLLWCVFTHLITHDKLNEYMSRKPKYLRGFLFCNALEAWSSRCLRVRCGGGAAVVTWGEEDDGHGDEGADHHDDQQSDGDALPVPLRRTDPAQVLRKHKEKRKKTTGQVKWCEVRLLCAPLVMPARLMGTLTLDTNKSKVGSWSGERINKEREKAS